MYSRFFDNGNYIYFSTELVYNKSRKLADCGDLTDDIVNQKKEYGSIKFDTTYSIPASWIPIIPGVVDHLTGVRYQVEIIPSSGSSYTIEHWHLAD